MSSNAPDLNPAENRPSEDTFAGVDCPALRSALREVFAEYAPSWISGSEGEFSLNRTLMRLAQRLDHGSDHAVPRGDIHEARDAKEGVSLLAAIRRNLLEQWRRKDLAVDKDRVLTLMHSIDLLSEELSIDLLTEELAPGAAEDLRARLAEPDAFRLMVEVAHDLRSPLTSILFLSEALRNGHSGSLTGLQQRQLGLIYSAALGLTGVANDLVSIAEEETAAHFEESVAFSLNETFEAVREMVEPMAESKRVALRFGVQCFGHRVGHPGPLARVLLNLTTNAIKFTREGGSVDVLADPVARDSVEISVNDTGRGISPEQKARLFQPFQKSQGRKGFFFASSGLGLSIVRRLLGGMDSELAIESEVGKGTRFSFTLRLPTPH